MGGYIGKYSRSPFSVFNEEKNYLFGLTQEGIPVTDDDQNDSRISAFIQVRRMAQLFGDYGTPNTSFIVGENTTVHAVDSFTATDTITLEAAEGDVSEQYPVGRKFTISGSSGGTNDGTYTVSSVTSATPTVITTVETTVTTQGSPSPAISTLNVNDFKVITENGPSNTDLELAGRLFVRGFMCILLHDVNYENVLSDIAEQSIHPRVTNVYYDAISHTVVEDSAANWGTNELAGRTVTVDGNGPFTITSNTADEFKIATDVTASIDNGNHYILELSTPGAPRTDAVYMNVYVDEYDSTDDPDLEKNLGGNAIEAQLRAKIIQTIFVREDNPTWGNLTDYVDSNGNQHFTFNLATLARDANNTITQSEITSHVESLGFTGVSLANMTPLRANITSPASDMLFVAPGQALNAAGDSVVAWPGGVSPVFADKEADPRIDVLILEEDGTLAIVKGTAAGSPVVPLFHGVPIVFVDIAAGSGDPTIQTVDLTDARTLYTPSEAPLIPSAESPPADTVYVAPGQVLSRDGTSIVSWAGGASPTFPVITTDPRKDVLVLKDDGTLARVEGDESGSPVVPKFFDTPIAIIDITETSTVIVNADDITDARTLLTPPPLGSTLRAEISGDAALSAVTVGETGCDFNDLGAAVAYVAALDTAGWIDADRQFAIYLFEKRWGQAWDISSDLILAPYVHLIGVGEPTLTSSSPYSYKIALYTYAKMKHIHTSGLKVTLSPHAKMSDCHVQYANTAAYNAAVLMSYSAMMSDCRIDRGGIAAPCVRTEDYTADAAVLIDNCKLINNGGAPVIDGGSSDSACKLHLGNIVYEPYPLIDVYEFTAPDKIIIDSSLPAFFQAGWKINVGGGAGGTNNGLYTVVSTTPVSGRTEITVEENIISGAVNPTPGSVQVSPIAEGIRLWLANNINATNKIELDSGVGDLTSVLTAGKKIVVTGATNPANNGVFTVQSSAFTTFTTITTVEVSLVTELGSSATVRLLTGNFEPVIQLDEYLEWTTRYANNVVYQAPCDLIVVAVGNLAGDTWYVFGYTDNSPNPTTRVANANLGPAAGSSTITFPVKKGDYWKVSASSLTTLYVLAKGR